MPTRPLTMNDEEQKRLTALFQDTRRLPEGMKFEPIPVVDHSAQLNRIEAKLDTLIAALADGDDGPGVDLDGQLIPGPRDETTTL